MRRMRGLFTFLTLSLLLASAPARAAEPPAAADIPATGAADPRCAPLDQLMRSFLEAHALPGAALAVARNGRLLYSRGFGFADVQAREPVQPDSLFRIASVSKPLTSAAIMLLVQQGKLSLDDHPFALPGLAPAPVEGHPPDPRLARITVRDLLTHAGGFDRDASGDPMFEAQKIADELHIASPPGPRDIIRWMAARPLDFDPGTKSVYSNFGYCVLGRVIEQASGEGYEAYVRKHVLLPLGISRMRIGRTLESGRAEGEVHYDSSEGAGPSVFADAPGSLPSPYGAWCLESMDAHGGWIASAPDLVRFASGLGEEGKLLDGKSLQALWARPSCVDPQAAAYYAFGWMVRPAGASANTWHNGSLPGTSTLLVRRHDGFVWAVLFNSREGDPAGEIDGLVHQAVDAVKEWPAGEALFKAP